MYVHAIRHAISNGHQTMQEFYYSLKKIFAHIHAGGKLKKMCTGMMKKTIRLRRSKMRRTLCEFSIIIVFSNIFFFHDMSFPFTQNV